MRAAGLTVEPADEIADPVFSVASKFITVNSNRVQVLEYADSDLANDEAARISPDGSEVGNSIVDWIAPPHYYKAGRLIVLYVGGRLDVIYALEAALGSQFAGQPKPATRSYTDAVLGITFDIPVEWKVDSLPGAATHFITRDPGGGRLSTLTVSVLSPESTTLDLALAEVRRGAWGRYLNTVRSLRLGQLDALRLEMTPGADRPAVAWVIVSPSGRAVGFIPKIDPDSIEGLLVTLRNAL